MSQWLEYASKVKQKKIFDDKLSFIPMLKYNENEDLPNKVFDLIRDEFNNADVKQIIIIDPYFSNNEFLNMVECFAIQTNRSIEIFTMLKNDNELDGFDIDNSFSKGDKPTIRELQRSNDKLKLINNSYKFILNKTFKKIIIYDVKIGFHDRYIYSPDNDDLYFIMGGSFNTKFKKYSNIIRITDFSFKMQILKLYEILKKNSEVINEY